MNNNLYLINAFSKEPFKGNPAAIVFLRKERADDWMAALAKELNQPITAFIRKKGESNYELRWFTPAEEIDLCGHGTLGAAHVLWSEGFTSPDAEIIFFTKSGPLRTKLADQKIALRFNVKETALTVVTEEIERAVNVPVIAAAWAEDRYLLELENQNSVQRAVPNLDAIKELKGPGVIITCSGSNQYDFVSRYFAPKIGINEDYVTGSAHCALASYWGNRLNKKEFIAYQDSERGGEIKLRIKGEQVEMIGDCVTLFKGHINR